MASAAVVAIVAIAVRARVAAVPVDRTSRA
jgi:hypothetical protein